MHGLCTLHIGFALSISVSSWSDGMHCVNFNFTLHFNFALSHSVSSRSDDMHCVHCLKSE